MVFRMRAYAHRVWAHRQRVSTTFLTRKNSQVFLVLLTGFEPRVMDSIVYRGRHSTNWAATSPRNVYTSAWFATTTTGWCLYIPMVRHYHDGVMSIHQHSSPLPRRDDDYRIIEMDTVRHNNAYSRDGGIVIQMAWYRRIHDMPWYRIQILYSSDQGNQNAISHMKKVHENLKPTSQYKQFNRTIERGIDSLLDWWAATTITSTRPAEATSQHRRCAIVDSSGSLWNPGQRRGRSAGELWQQETAATGHMHYQDVDR